MTKAHDAQKVKVESGLCHRSVGSWNGEVSCGVGAMGVDVFRASKVVNGYGSELGRRYRE